MLVTSPSELLLLLPLTITTTTIIIVTITITIIMIIHYFHTAIVLFAMLLLLYKKIEYKKVLKDKFYGILFAPPEKTEEKKRKEKQTKRTGE